MDKFAKLFEFADLGQVVAIRREGDDGPEVRFHFRPPGLGVCSTAALYADDDDGHARADRFFAGLDAAGARNALEALYTARVVWLGPGDDSPED